DTRRVAVSTSAVMPWRWSVLPTGPVVRSTAVRQRPSNMKLLVVRGPGQGSGAVKTEVYHPAPETRGPGGRRTRPLGPTPWPLRTAARVLHSWWQGISSRLGPAGDQSREASGPYPSLRHQSNIDHRGP